MFEFDNLCKNCDLRAAQRVPISTFSCGGGACPQTLLGGHAYTCHGLTPGIHHSLTALHTTKPDMGQTDSMNTTKPNMGQTDSVNTTKLDTG